MKKLSSLFLALAASITLMQATTVDLSSISANYTVQDGDTLTGTGSSAYNIIIPDGVEVTLSDLHLTFTDRGKSIVCQGNAIINIADGTQSTLSNTETYYQSNAVINIGSTGTTTTINGTTGKLTITPGRYAPSIGALGGDYRGNIVINGGVIVANSWGEAPAIGCIETNASGMKMGNITINGGDITANGGSWNPAIGADGDHTTCGNITINGGTVKANGGNRGVGVGGRCADIIIIDGVINASVSEGNGAGIGSGNGRSCGNIIIKGGTVTATGSGDAPAIGAGVGGSCGMIYIASNMDDVTEGQTRTLTPNGSPVDVERDENGYYLLGSLNNWKFFYLESQADPTVKAKMTADIDLGANLLTIGTIDAPYQGTFDGQGHKLTINFTPTEERFGLFRFIIGATIQNLHLAGAITTEYRMTGSLVGRIDGGTCNISNCRSSVYVHSTTAEGHQTGGFIGRISNGILNISDCLFDGSVIGETSSEFCGGIVGYNAGTLNMSNCLFMPETAQIGSASTSTLVQNAGTPNIVNSYYTKSMGTIQGIEATAEELADGTIAAALQNGRDEEIWVQDPVLNTPMLKIFANPKPGPATAIDEANADVKATKRFVNGQLLIEKNGKFYNATGAEVK